ncbi:conserved hypothetical protein [Aeromonas salmonicida]|nr:conserved hypothetical protein [Aeromonas salmonicida]
MPSVCPTTSMWLHRISQRRSAPMDEDPASGIKRASITKWAQEHQAIREKWLPGQKNGSEVAGSGIYRQKNGPTKGTERNTHIKTNTLCY